MKLMEETYFISTDIIRHRMPVLYWHTGHRPTQWIYLILMNIYTLFQLAPSILHEANLIICNYASGTILYKSLIVFITCSSFSSFKRFKEFCFHIDGLIHENKKSSMSLPLSVRACKTGCGILMIYWYIYCMYFLPINRVHAVPCLLKMIDMKLTNV